MLELLGYHIVKTKSLSHLGSDRYQVVTDRHQDRITGTIANSLSRRNRTILSIPKCGAIHRLISAVLIRYYYTKIHAHWSEQLIVNVN